MKDLSIYIHIPFCESKCKYCDFLSYDNKKESIDNYLDVLNNEILNYSLQLDNYIIKSIFIGGGTPSILSCKQIEDLFNNLRNNYNISKECEITIETNPGTLDMNKAEMYKSCGVNRISLGLQSTNNKTLKALGRIHTYEDFLINYHMIREVGIHNINIDLMFGLPSQSIEDWKHTLLEIAKLKPEHVSCYSLIIEEGTKFYDMYEEDSLILPNEEDERIMYWLTREILGENNYKHYEISNYALQNKECYHNKVYWKEKEYIGMGLGASSFFQDTRYRNTNKIETYIRSKGSIEQLKEDIQPINKETKIEEFMFLGLRLLEGINVNDFKVVFDDNIDKYYKKVIDDLLKKELLIRERDIIKLTNKGIDISNYVFQQFLLD